MHRARLPLGGQTGISPAGSTSEPRAPLAGQGVARGKKNLGVARCWSWVERSRVVVSVLDLPLHPCKGLVCTVTRRQRHLKINQPKADKEGSCGEGMGWMQGHEMFKRFESKPKPRSKRQPPHSVKPPQASQHHFRLLKEIVGCG